MAFFLFFYKVLELLDLYSPSDKMIHLMSKCEKKNQLLYDWYCNGPKLLFPGIFAVDGRIKQSENR